MLKSAQKIHLQSKSLFGLMSYFMSGNFHCVHILRWRIRISLNTQKHIDRNSYEYFSECEILEWNSAATNGLQTTDQSAPFLAYLLCKQKFFFALCIVFWFSAHTFYANENNNFHIVHRTKTAAAAAVAANRPKTNLSPLYTISLWSCFCSSFFLSFSRLFLHHVIFALATHSSALCCSSFSFALVLILKK